MPSDARGALVSQLPPVLAATGPFFMFSLEETFELIAEAGFDGAELMITQDRVSQDPHRLGALAARYGVPLPSELTRWPALTLDTSHLAAAGGDLMMAWDDLADRVVHLHVSNNDGRGRDTHGLLDRGVLPVPEFLEEVGAAGFGGAVTLELDVRTWADDRPALLEVLRENLDIARLHLAAGEHRARSRATIQNR